MLIIADQEFWRGGCVNSLLGNFFIRKCVKFKEFGLRGWGMHPCVGTWTGTGTRTGT